MERTTEGQENWDGQEGSNLTDTLDSCGPVVCGPTHEAESTGVLARGRLKERDEVVVPDACAQSEVAHQSEHRGDDESYSYRLLVHPTQGYPEEKKPAERERVRSEDACGEERELPTTTSRLE